MCLQDLCRRQVCWPIDAERGQVRAREGKGGREGKARRPEEEEDCVLKKRGCCFKIKRFVPLSFWPFDDTFLISRISVTLEISSVSR